jgi:hypothetical protein
MNLNEYESRLVGKSPAELGAALDELEAEGFSADARRYLRARIMLAMSDRIFLDLATGSSERLRIMSRMYIRGNP